MAPEIDQISIKELDATCRRVEFRCGNREIDSWFGQKAAKRHERQAVRVRTAHLKNNPEVAGFSALTICERPTSLLSSEIERQGWESASFPACYLQFLAVHQKLQGKKIGTKLLLNAIEVTYEVSRLVGIHGLVLNAADKSKTQFYERLGFGVIGPDISSPWMLLPIRTIRELVESNNDA